MYTFIVMFVALTAAYGAIWHFQSDKRQDPNPFRQSHSESQTSPAPTPPAANPHR